MVADLRYFNSLEHEVDTLKSQLETQKTQFLNEIDRLSREYYYADHMNAILGVYTDLDEFTNLQCDYVETWEKCEHLEKELSKSRTNVKECKEKIKNDKSFKENQSNVFLKEREQYFEIQDLKAQLQDKGIAINFASELSAHLSRTQMVMAPGMFKVHSKPIKLEHLKEIKLEDRVMPNNSQGKKQNVEDHHRHFKFSNNKTSVTACNDSLNAKTSNVNFVCVTCGKYVLNDNHDLCVLHYINGVNSRTRQPMAVPVSTREPNHNVNQSVATFSKKTVTTDSTFKKSRNITRKLYEQVSKTCSWWYPKYTPSGYNWKPKSQKGNVNPNISMPLGNASRTANILEHKTPRCSTVSNTPLSSNSFASRRDHSIHRRLWVLKVLVAQSKAYRIFNKRTRMIVETIHVNFDELPQMASDHVSSDPGLQCSTTVLEQDSLSPGPQSQENVPQIAETVTTSNKLELLYSPMFSELLNGTSLVVSKSSAVHAADASNKRQQQPDSTSSTSTLATTVTANGNFDL
ncbi:hypothetical protein Tco_0840153 [Tanacetum coccineum]|uniref:Uncharacterized protein n=1 Tax=Tanacetum coccineum TaxID=301880 RepID=A0ABQ5ASQ0_9ASTR